MTKAISIAATTLLLGLGLGLCLVASRPAPSLGRDAPPAQAAPAPTPAVPVSWPALRPVPAPGDDGWLDDLAPDQHDSFAQAIASALWPMGMEAGESLATSLGMRALTSSEFAREPTLPRTASLPEPAVLAMLLPGAAFLLARRRC